MKKTITSLFVMGVVLLTACNKNETTPRTATAEQSTTSALMPQDALFKEIYEDLSYFAALYEEGDIMTLSLKDNKVIMELTNVGKSYQVLSEHDYSSKNKLAFAKWCNKQLEAGHVLKIGYDKSTGTYWADIIS